MRGILMFIVSALCCCFISNSYCQNISKLEKKGDKLYENDAFIHALSIYEKAHKKFPERKEINLKLANTYRLLNQQENAERWYASVINEKEIIEPMDQYFYAEALSSMGRYQEAKKWFEKYNETEESDEIVQEKIEALNKHQLFFRNADKVFVSIADFNSSASDFSPTDFNGEIVFVSSRKGATSGKGKFKWDDSYFLDIFENTGTKIIPLDKGIINTDYHEGPADFYDHGKKIIYTKSNAVKGKVHADSALQVHLNLYTSSFLNGEWQSPIPLNLNNEAYSVGHPSITEKGDTLFFVSDMPGGFGGTDIYRSIRTEEGVWSPPVNLGKEINTPSDELFPYIWKNRHLYFSSKGYGGMGGLDIYVVDLENSKGLTVENVGSPINSIKDDFGIMLDKVGESGYFSSNRKGGIGGDDIYSFYTTGSLTTSYKIRGILISQAQSIPLIKQKVYLYDKNNKVIDSTFSDKGGNFIFNVEPATTYAIVTKPEGYFEKKKNVNTIGDKEQKEWIVINEFVKESGFSLKGKIKDLRSNVNVPNLTVRIIDNLNNNLVYDETINSDSEFTYPIKKALNERVSYQIKLSSPGYIEKTLTYNGQLDKIGAINLNEIMDLKLEKIAIGTDLSDFINIEPIYFKSGGYTILPNAGKVLDKVVEFMQLNPNIEIRLESHTDCLGKASENLELSEKRANQSKLYLVSKGVSESRIESKGYGETKILNGCVDGVKCSKAQHAANRRTAFIITKFE